MFVGPLTDNSRSHTRGGTGNANSSSSTTGTSATRIGQDCLPRREPLTEARAALSRIESRSFASILNPGNASLSAFDRVTIAANASAGGIDADLPLNRPLAAISQLSQREATTANTGGKDGGSKGNGSSSSSSTNKPRSEGNIEVFLASLGVDYRETQRMLQYVRQSRLPAGGAGTTPMASPLLFGGDGRAGSVMAGSPSIARRNPDGTLDGSTSGPLSTSTLDVEAFMRARRAESLGAAIRDVQHAMANRERLSAASATASVGGIDHQHSQNQFAYASSSFSSANPSPLPGALKPTPNTGSTPNLIFATSPITATPRGIGADSAKMQQNVNDGMDRALSLSSSVTRYPSAEWLTRFSFTAHQQVDSIEHGGDLDDLWQGTQRILRFVPVSVSAKAPATAEQVSRLPGAHPLLVAAAGSRRSIEYNFMRSILKTIGWFDSSDISPENIDAARVVEAINKYCASGRSHRSALNNVSAWTKTFLAMRAGQWNAAASVCPDQKVAAALRDDLRGEALPSEASAPLEGNNARVAVSVHEHADHMANLFKDDATRKDPFRGAVLFLLLRGRNLAPSTNSASTELTDIIRQVSSFIDDVLWIRLCLVECLDIAVQDNSNNSNKKPNALPLHPFHGLKDLQSSILAENPQTLMSTFGNNTHRLANFYFHALLPSTSIRALMTASGASTVDAVHLAIVYYQRGLIVEGPSQSAEPSLPFEETLKHFVMSLITARSASPAKIETPLLHTAFGYFRSVGLYESFVNICAHNTAFSYKLFGDLLPSNNIASNRNRENFASLIDAATRQQQKNLSLSAAASPFDFLKLLNDVGQRAQIVAQSALAAQMSIICYAHAAFLCRRDQDAEVEKISRDALSRAYGSTIPPISKALNHAISSRCAIIRPNTEFTGENGAYVRAGSVPIPHELIQCARNISDVVEAVGNLSVMHSLDGKLQRLTAQFDILVGLIQIVNAWDDKDDERVVHLFFGLSVVPFTESQIDASTQHLNQLPEFCVILISRALLVVEHSIQRLLGAYKLHRRSIAQNSGGSSSSGNVMNEVGTQISRLEAQADLLRIWAGRWSQKCRIVGNSGALK